MGEAEALRPGAEHVLEIDVGRYVLSVPTGFGPRVLGLRLGEGPELFAVLDDEIAIRSIEGTYRFRGGHRLWAAPEVPSLTYAPDDHPCEVRVGVGGVTIAARPDTAGIGKEIEVRPQGGRLRVTHRLTNAGMRTVRLAPWAITQLRLGGIALVPFGAPVDGSPEADRSLALWPYTDLSDRRVGWRPWGLVVDASPGPRWKAGVGPDPQRLGYLIDGHLFVKHIPPAGEGDQPDRGAVGQVFVDDSFCELESIGAAIDLTPGATASHTEAWSVEECDGADTAVDRLLERVPG